MLTLFLSDIIKYIDPSKILIKMYSDLDFRVSSGTVRQKQKEIDRKTRREMSGKVEVRTVG